MSLNIGDNSDMDQHFTCLIWLFKKFTWEKSGDYLTISLPIWYFRYR